METRSSLESRLTSNGLSWMSAQAVANATAKHRHQWRCLQVPKAVMEDMGYQSSALIAGLICLEAMNCGTARLSCFQSLGKGRKEASDGPAWTAAILAHRNTQCKIVPFRCIEWTIKAEVDSCTDDGIISADLGICELQAKIADARGWLANDLAFHKKLTTAGLLYSLGMGSGSIEYGDTVVGYLDNNLDGWDKYMQELYKIECKLNENSYVE